MTPQAQAKTLIIEDFDAVPQGAAAPLRVDLLHPLLSDDGSEYWLGSLEQPILYQKDGQSVDVRHAVVAPGWAGTSFHHAFEGGRVNLAYVTDNTLLNDAKMSFAKVDYVAFGAGRLMFAQRSGAGQMGVLAKMRTWFA